MTNLPKQLTVPPMPQSLKKTPFISSYEYVCDIKGSQTFCNEDLTDILNTLEDCGYSIFQRGTNKYSVVKLNNEDMGGSKEVFINRIHSLLIDEAQCNSSKYGFKLGDTIKYTPSEVAEVLRKRYFKEEDSKEDYTIKVRQVRHWVETENPNYSPFDGSSEYKYTCPACGKENHSGKTRFCPHCGLYFGGGEL